MEQLDDPKKILRVLTILKKELPDCFKDINKKQPLKSGIDLDLIEHYKDDDRFTAEDLHQALHFYTNGRHYLQSIVEGAARINLAGKKVDVVNAEDAGFSKEMLLRHNKNGSTMPEPAEIDDEDNEDEVIE